MSARSAPERLRRRDRMRRALFWIAVGAALVIAVMLVRCGGGFGFGGGGGNGLGKGRGSGGAHGAVGAGSGVAPARCAVRVDVTGLTVDGRAASIEATVAACRATGAADVVVTGDARQGTWDRLRAALDAAAIAIHVRGPDALTPDAGP